MTNKSPFYIIREFASPLLCEDIIDACDFNVPDKDKDENDILTVRNNELAQQYVYERLLLALPEIQAHFQFLYKGTEPINFEWFPQGASNKHHSENSDLLRGKWLRTKGRDFTGVLFLSEHNTNVPFDDEFEVLGGKLEFPQHYFGFEPERGTLVVFPSDPHFINVTAPILAGDLYQARIQIAAHAPYIYNPQEFPGNYTTWFQPLLNK